MTRGQKKMRIRRLIEDALPGVDYLEREQIIRAWMPYSLSTLEASLDAGFETPEGNPYVDPDLPLNLNSNR